jgi:hypothetical protein
MAKRNGSTSLTKSEWLELGFTVGPDGALYGVPAAVDPSPILEDQGCGCCGCGDDQPCLCDHGADCPACPDPECPCCARVA